MALAESRAYEQRGRYDLAWAAAHRALEAAQRPADRADALSQLALLRYRMGRFDEAESLASQSLNLAPASYSSVWSNLILGLCATTAGQLETGEAHYRRAEDLSLELGYDYGRALVLINLGHMVYWMRGQYALALDTSDESRRLYSALGLSIMSHVTFHAIIAVRMGDRERARQALAELAKIVPPGSWQAGQFANLSARLAILNEDFDQADQWLQRAKAIADATGDSLVGATVLTTLSAYWRAREQPAQALDWSATAIDQARRKPFRLGEETALTEHGRAAWALGDQAGAMADWAAAQHIAQELGDAVGLAEATLLLAAAQQATGAPQAESTWLEVARLIQFRELGFVLENERDLAFPSLVAYSRSADSTVRAAAEQLLARLETVPPRSLHIRGLGQFTVRQGARQVPDRSWARRRAGEVFRFLLLQPNHSAAREVVLEHLWPDQEPEAAQSLLYQATSTLRRILEPDLPDRFPSRYLAATADTLALLLPPGSQLDFVEFEQTLAPLLRDPDPPFQTEPAQQGAAQTRAAELEAALQTYAGELFPADRYADWAAAARERLALLHQAGLLRLAQSYLAAERYDLALETSRRLLGLDPWREDAALAGMQACLATGDRPGALRLYLTLEQNLRQDLHISPRVDLQQLAASLRD
ncbi:MAG: hypothetical protein IT317_21690 [Anaerolineales bacterium]|nr:hypothetical protein [Anaerolineales bacterium]